MENFEVVRKPDGSVALNRKEPPTRSPESDPNLPIPVLSKDLTINPSNNTWLRLFLPRNSLSGITKLPLIVFFHGSGFIITSAATPMSHDFCVHTAEGAAAVVASLEYRLAPEHRLPAAYDDAVEALQFIRTSEDPWLTQHVDYSKVYLMGSSAGATIAYHAGLRAAAEVDLEPLKIQGLILRQACFGGTQRSESELRLLDDPLIPLLDLVWELALPVGADRDHEYSNLTAGNEDGLEKVRDRGWRVLVSGNGGDPLVSREKELVKLMEKKGVVVVSDFDDDGYHGVEYGDPHKANRLVDLVKRFIHSSSPHT